VDDARKMFARARSLPSGVAAAASPARSPTSGARSAAAQETYMDVDDDESDLKSEVCVLLHTPV